MTIVSPQDPFLPERAELRAEREGIKILFAGKYFTYTFLFLPAN